MNKLFFLILTFLLIPVSVQAHRGGIDANGGHFNSSTGDYHCHRPNCIPPQAASLSIFIIDVGQGDSTFIVGPQRNLLIDSGDNRWINGAAIVGDVISDLNIQALDYVVLSHYDADHMGGFVTIGNGHNSLLWNRTGDIDDPVCTPKPLFPSVALFDIGVPVGSSQSRKEWRNCLERLTGANNQPEHIEIDGADDLDNILDLGGGFTATIVTGRGFVIDHPARIPSADSPNEMSISVLVSGPNGFDFLVTGDLIGIPTNSTEDSLLESALGESLKARGIDLEILRIGHHGAANATEPEFLKDTHPEVAIISVGDNSWNHPRCSTLKNIEQNEVSLVFQTEPGRTTCDGALPLIPEVINGTIRIDVSSQGNYNISTFSEISPITNRETTQFLFECTLASCERIE